MKETNPAPNKIRKQSSSGAQSTGSRAAFSTSRSFYFLFSILVFALLTFLAHRQSPRPDPFQPVQALSWDWWKYPIERNAFKRLPVITSNLNDVFALPNSEKVWAVGDEGMIVHSEDGGETWVQQEVDWEAVKDSVLTQDLTEQEQQVDPKQNFNANAPIDFAQKKAPSNVAQKGFDPLQRQTSTPAETTATKSSDSKPNLRSVYFINENHGWMVGTSGTILATKDGGQTWQRQTTSTEEWLTSIYFIGPDSGWACGHNGIFLSTANGGQNWQARKIVDSDYLESVFFVDAKKGWVFGGGLKNETILVTHDGGQSWQTQTSGGNHWFQSVRFTDAQRGYAVAHSGAIVTTRDGGQSWQQEESGTDESFEAVYFASKNAGWVVSDNGAITSTRDAGKTWREQKSGTTEDLASVSFRDENTGWAVGEKGTILMTHNGGQSWNKLALGGSSKFNSVHFVDEKRGWIAANDGTVLATLDGGRQWNAQESGTTNALESIFFHDANLGWAVGDNGTILRTRNGGLVWQLQMNDSSATLNAVTFADAQTGWAVGAPGVIIATRDGGQSWISQAWGGNILFNAVCFVDAKTGWVVGNLPMNRSAGIILKTVDGGQNWFSQTVHSEINFLLSNVHFVDSNTGWAVGLVRILSTRDGGQTWQRQMAGATIWPFSVYFVDAKRGWTAGMHGQIYSTDNGGQVWNAHYSGTEAILTSIRFFNPSIGWVVGEERTILATTDGGQIWKDPTLPYSRAFAPWYYLSLLLIAPLLYLAFRKPKPIAAEQKTVADMLVSDRPIAAGDPDPLEFNTIARGLSRFLRNENTQPPLTIAITGEWGSGKSSLMNLLKADLKRYGFRPVWFNAWHHQKEEHLLAALLENVRNQAIPPWWRLEGLSFRCHLLWLRAKRRRFVAALLLLLFAFAVGYVAVDPSARLTNIKTHVTNLEKGISDVVIALLPTKPAPKDSAEAQDLSTNNGADSSNSFSLLPLLLSAMASLVIVYRGLKAFGVNPVSLMASMSGQFKAGDLKAQMSFRYRFAQEFDEVTRALHPRTMLIFIDDLDRCQPKSVLEVLEAVNFLVSNGECYVVLGLDLQRVERYVEEGFKDVKEEGFARQYLQKLINIEVPVPQPSELQSRNLIAPKAREPERARSWWVAAFRKAPQFLPKLLPPVIVAATLIAGFMLGQSLFPDEKKEQSSQATIASPAKSDSTSTVVAPVDTTRATSRSEADTPERASGEGKFIPGQQAKPVLTWAFVALALMLLLAAWRLSIPSDVIVQDSPEFEEALRIWHPLIMAKHNTPRSVKRFVNRVRYFAMRQSSEAEAQSVWQKLSVWAGFMPKEEAKEVEAVSESILVALSAIHHFEPDWVERICQWRGSADGLQMTKPLSPDENFLGTQELEGSLQGHIKKFGNWPPNEEDRNRLEKLSAGIRIN